MRIVVLDGHTLNPGDNPWAPVAALGELEVYALTAPDEVLERAGGAAIVLTNKTRLDRTTLAALQRDGLRFVGVLATGWDVVDVAAATDLGIPVANVPEYGTDSVAEFVFAQLLTWARRPDLHDAAVRDGQWTSCGEFSFHVTPQRELAGLQLGIVGYGRIGRRVAALGQAFGMQVRAVGRPGGALPDTIACDGLNALLEASDVVTLHCPLTPDTAGMLDADRLARMRPGSLLVNTARGALIDEAALAEALAAGRPGWACLDVAVAEPMAADHPLLALPNCSVTPHMAWSTLAARRRLMATTAANIEAFLAGRPRHLVG